MGRQPDNDKKQQIRDNFLARNRYALDLRFVLRDGKKHPAAILIPGGAYRAVCSFIEGVPIARKLNERGISAVILYYRVRRKASYPAPMDDLARAVRECLEKADELGLDMDSYSVWGASAGGHLAGSFGTENMGYIKYGLPKPSALILEYPVISMMPGLTHGVTHDNLLGKNATREMEELSSIEKHVTKNYPPTYVWCGDCDETVPPENTRIMAEQLEKTGVRNLCDVFPGVGHGVGPGTGTSAEGWIDTAVSFWLNKE